MNDKALQQVEQIPVSGADALVRIIDRAATDPAFDVQKLQQLLEMKERWEASEAKKAYVVAMNAFKADPPEVFKSSHVHYVSKKTGEATEYDHAKLEDAVDAIGTALSNHGLSFRWDCDQLEGGIVKVTCVMTHVQGHSECVPLQAGRDESGGKNNIQALASTVTYLQRYTLFSATGLAAKGVDDDGRGSEPAKTITTDQAIVINDLLTETKKDKMKFLEQFKFDSIDTIPSSEYDRVMLALNERKRKIAEKVIKENL